MTSIRRKAGQATEQAVAPNGSTVGAAIPVRQNSDPVVALQVENARLQTALTSRIVIEQAKGAISARYDTTPDVAFEMLRGLARSQRRNLHEYAEAIVAGAGRLDV
jgi:AmiR/NasT family two-component response regulator